MFFDDWITGPCRSLKGGSDVKVHPESWNKVSNMLFVDQPVGTGFSFGKKLLKSSEQAAQDTYTFLQRFFEKFPEYSKMNFHIFGESYAGHYTKLIDKKNILIKSNKMKAIPINFRSIGIGNGWIDPRIQSILNIYSRTYNVLSKVIPDFAEFNSYGPVLNSSELAVLRSEFPKCNRLIDKCYKTGSPKDCVDAQDFCYFKFVFHFYLSSGLNGFDIRTPAETTNSFPPPDYNLYLAKPEIKQLSGHRKITLNVLMTLMILSTSMVIQGVVIKQRLNISLIGFPVLLYYGDADFDTNWFGGKELANALNWPFKSEFNKTSVRQWIVNDKPAGEIKSFDKLTFIRVFQAGHEVPFYQPRNSLEMFSKWINNEKLLSIKINN